jgi:hypothetical protein
MLNKYCRIVYDSIPNNSFNQWISLQKIYCKHGFISVFSLAKTYGQWILIRKLKLLVVLPVGE